MDAAAAAAGNNAAAAAAAAGAAADAAALQLQNALGAHERVRKSTELPLFYGRKEKDTCEAQLLIDRFDTAARIANWGTDARKCEEFYLLLRDRALQWWKALDEQPGVNKAIWAQVKTQFLNFYGQRHAARAVCSNFAELSHKHGESVHDYYLKVMEVYNRIKEMRPDNMAVPRAQNATARAYKQEGIDDMGRYFMLQLFLAGLKEEIKVKTMENVPETLGDAVTRARNMEVIVNDKAKMSKSSITSISEEYEIFEEKIGETEDINEVMRHINAMRMKSGKKPFNMSGNRTGTAGRFANVICRFCKNKGHTQNICKKRIAAKAPCVDEKGVPYKKVNSTQEVHKEEGGHSSQVSLVGYYDVINSINLN
jgi:Retrotransposon gag protein